MGLFKAEEIGFARAVGKLVACNHFLPERIDYEREALGDDFSEEAEVWSARPGVTRERSNVLRLAERVEQVADGAREVLLEWGRGRGGKGGTEGGVSAEDLQLYEDLAVYQLYYRYVWRVENPGMGIGMAARRRKVHTRDMTRGVGKVAMYAEFAQEVERWLKLPGVTLPNNYEAEHLMGIFFQIWRAFTQIHSALVGASLPMAKLRAAVWESIFTHDIRRFRRGLYARMGDMTTLITGESGTGKELVARAIALSRHIPFDAKKQAYVADWAEGFLPLNLSALSPTLIESELFGHRRGAFTGAIEERVGWLEVCAPQGTVFLDEIGELDGQIQVKLLRVLQDRVFQRLGDTQTRHFAGKIIAATNRDLAAEIAEGRFREDFYYRICGDIVQTPTLREQLAAGGKGELETLVRFIARRVAGEEAEGKGGLAEEVLGWIGKHMEPGYAWPGNFRELEQCVRNVMIRQEYRPRVREAGRGGRGGDEGVALVREMHEGGVTAEEVIRRYCRMMYERTKSYEETGRRLGLDRRTVKAKVEGLETAI